MFTHIYDDNFLELEVSEVNEHRYYKTPSGVLLPSVTTILGAIDKPELKKWKQKVGEKKSNQVRDRAIDRGHILHDLCETYLNNEPVNKNNIMPYIWALFLSIKPYLNHIDNIRALESVLYSEKIGIAGRVDCIGTYEDKLMVLDFKGSTKVKKLEQIPHYCIQACAYGMLFEEMTNICIEDAMIIMGVEQERPLLFQIKVNDYKGKLLDLINTWYEQNNRTRKTNFVIASRT